jgi:hypothetical protein
MDQNPEVARMVDFRENEIDFSIVIALLNHGGHWEESIRSWAREQDYPRGKYEMIVVSNGRHAQIDEGVRGLLAKHDSFVFSDLTEEFAVYDFGARLARGKYLFFAEAHSIGQPNCLSQMMRYLSETRRPGAMCNSYGEWNSYIGRFQEVLFQREIKSFVADDFWHRIAMRGSAILRSIYIEYDGFQRKYLTFGDRALDINLFCNGVRLGYAVDAIVKHHNISGYRHLDFATRLYTHGECAYRNDNSEIHCLKYIGDSRPWNERLFCHPDIARLRYRALRHVITSRLRHLKTWTSAARAMPELIELKLLDRFGAKWILLKARIRKRLWKSGVQLFYAVRNEKLARRCFHEYFYLASVAYFQTEYIAEHPTQLTTKPRLVFPMHEDLDDHISGFYQIERSDTGELYRWTPPVSSLSMAMPIGNYVVEIEDAGCRPANLKSNVAVFFNTFQLQQVPASDNAMALRFKILKGHFSGSDTQHLIISSDCFKPSRYGSKDDRRLGIPITKVSFHPVPSEDQSPYVDPTSRSLRTWAEVGEELGRVDNIC